MGGFIERYLLVHRYTAHVSRAISQFSNTNVYLMRQARIIFHKYLTYMHNLSWLNDDMSPNIIRFYERITIIAWWCQ